MGRVTPGIIIPLVILPIALIGVWIWYQRTVRNPHDTAPRPISANRLTAEALHRLASPPWRIVYEIGGQPTGVDHVVVCPAGVVAVRTTAADRPPPERQTGGAGSPHLVADSAIARGAVDELLATVGVRCDTLAVVFWGRPDQRRPAAEASLYATMHVEGQRLAEWLAHWNAHAPATLDAARIDLAWRAVTTGIGRPDPLS